MTGPIAARSGERNGASGITSPRAGEGAYAKRLAHTLTRHSHETLEIASVRIRNQRCDRQTQPDGLCLPHG